MSVKDLAIGGEEIMKIMGIGPGPVVGKILRQLLEEVIKDPSRNNPRNLIAMVEKIKEDHEKVNN